MLLYTANVVIYLITPIFFRSYSKNFRNGGEIKKTPDRCRHQEYGYNHIYCQVHSIIIFKLENLIGVLAYLAVIADAFGDTALSSSVLDRFNELLEDS